ncbi:MAG: hypothetical protein WBH01_02970 [Dehalococcoidia bacterium]
MTRKKIRGSMANLLTYIGSLYRNPADAIKEYTSNAVDEWQKARDRGEMKGPCEVSYLLQKGKITIDYNAPGMSEEEFDEALDRVADSVKPGMSVLQIGQLGIGIFAFNQVGTSCTFYSKKAKGMPTIKAVLRKQSEYADMETAIKRESRKEPGMTIVISGLQHDPTGLRGPLGAERLQHVFAEKFDPYLREGNLKIAISCGGRDYQVEPLAINLPSVGEAFREVHLSSDWQKVFGCQLWFDASGKSKIAIRHAGIPVVEDVKAVQAYGLEESIYASGFLKGYIDGDFLKPLPARAGFEENQDWIQFLLELEKTCPSIEYEVEELRVETEEKKLTQIQRRAIELAWDILNQGDFKGLELLGGLTRPRGPITQHPGTHKGRQTGGRSRKPGVVPRRSGMRIAFEEVAFEDGPSYHSRLLSGIVQVNKYNPDSRREMVGSEEAKLSYATTMIGKETIAYNDKSKAVNDFLEKLLSFMFQVKRKAKI